MFGLLRRGLGSFLFSSQKLQGPRPYSEVVSRARNIMNLYDLNVYNEGFVFLAPNATVIGDVFMGADIAIWHGTVIRGDINRVTLVSNISIGNNCVLHTAASSPTGLRAELILQGDNVIQNNCTLYSCTIEPEVYVGHNSVIMQGAILRKGCIIAPNSVVPPGRVVKERQVWGGNPIKYVRKAMEQQGFVTLDYARYANKHSQAYNNAFLPYGNAYLYKHGPAEPIDRYITVNEIDREEKFTFYDPAEATITRY